ncbi:DNA-binding transcriptional LysR family regulator [Arthrobacter ginsengisoli]|uniref:DNA-binding transcriptional LysR family regulator n=1 Tax=Arthrobacter ginsengisoli TaxID=1356565 RepID=A0ABU1UHM9_9MICC|nr:LysR family transcriptional regulator [Arthrobacter ginsengisoli]MDR7084707.1 DNA-binding transcriptional LysR family regulator [Arthrobacter ginsengisoli]
MELRHLEYFVAVAEELNFTAAAGRLYVVQSAVSAGIKALERELEVTLFDRTSRRVDLSEAGAAFLPHAYATLDAARGARDALAQVQGGLRGIVRVGTMTSVGIIDVPELLGDFHRQHPGVLLQLSAAPSGSQGLVDAVAERRLDLAFVSIPGENPPHITLTSLGHEPMDLVLPVSHPLAEATTVAVVDLADYDFIDSPVGYGNRAVSDRAFASTGTSRRVIIEVTDIATAPAYVRNGLGLALLPRFVLQDIHDLAVRPVTGADLGWPMSLATPRNRTLSAAAAALVKLIKDSVK